MVRVASVVGAAIAVVGIVTPHAAVSQTPDHVDPPGQAHSHVGAPVPCTNLASPPWTGLPEGDRQQYASVQESLALLSTPEAAQAAGFRPALGEIPGMGVHYVHSARSRDGVNIDEPDHLLFSTIDGQEQLVGAAYAFTDVPDTDVPIPFESDLAHWHDHPQFAGPGETLHMLHLWFIPSSNGPFAGLNFWLPFRTAGIEPPSSCWMADEADANRIQTVSFSLVTPRSESGAAAHAARMAARSELLAELDAAARAVDHTAWVAAADQFIADLEPAERTMVGFLLGALNMAQMSSGERGATGN